jgi:hypothetical protein
VARDGVNEGTWSAGPAKGGIKQDATAHTEIGSGRAFDRIEPHAYNAYA